MSATYIQHRLPVTSLAVLDRAIELCPEVNWSSKPAILAKIEQNQKDFNSTMKMVEETASIIESLGIEIGTSTEDLEILAQRSGSAAQSNIEATDAMNKLQSGMNKLEQLINSRKQLLDRVENNLPSSLALTTGSGQINITKRIGNYTFSSTNRQSWVSKLDAAYRLSLIHI